MMERRWRERCGRRSPQPPQPPAGPAPLYARRSLSARCGRGALGAAAGAGKGRDAPGLGAIGGTRAGPRRRGGARAERGQRGPAGAPCARYHSRCICARSTAPTAVHEASCPAECSELHLYVSWAVRAGVSMGEKTCCLANRPRRMHLFVHAMHAFFTATDRRNLPLGLVCNLCLNYRIAILQFHFGHLKQI